MSLIVTFNGNNYIIPTTNEVGWGSNLDAYFVAIAAGCLQKTGGLFTLSADVDFGASFGLKSVYYESRATHVGSVGAVRLQGNNDVIAWRSVANDADFVLGTSATNQLIYAGIPIALNQFTANRAILSDGSGHLDVSPTTSTELGYVHGVTSAIQTQLDSKAPTASPTFTGLVTAPQFLATTNMAIGAATNGIRALYTNTSYVTQIETNSTTAGFSFNGGVIGGGVIFGTWQNPGTPAAGDYGLMINMGFKNSAAAVQEFAEIGAVVVDPTAGNETARMVFNLRGAGNGFLSDQVLFSITPITNTGSILNWGRSSVNDPAPSKGGGYLWSTDAGNAGFSAGTQFDGTNFTARTATPVTMFLNKSGDSFQLCTDYGLTPGNTFTPTPRLSIDSSGNVAIAGNATATRIDLTGGIGIGLLNQSQIEFADFGNVHAATFQAPNAFTTSFNYGLPAAPPAVNGAVMTCLTSGSMAWTSTIPVSNGGTGVATLAAHGVLIGNGTGNVVVSAAGSSGQVLTSNGASADPTFQTLSGTGTVNSGTQFQLAYYATSTNAVSGLTLITASRALASDANGLPVAATTTATELGFVSGVTSAIQTQLNLKAPLASPTFTGTVTASTTNITGDLTLSSGTLTSLDITASSATRLGATIENTNNANVAAHASLFLKSGGTSGGDPYLRFNVPATTNWALGLNNADGDAFELTNGDDLTATQLLRVDKTTLGVAIHGTNTNDNATAGFVGETILGNQTTLTNFPTSTQWGDLISISLTAGDWLVWGTYELVNNSGTTTEFSIAVTSTFGNSTTGFTNGLNNFQYRAASLTGTNDGQLTVSAVRFSLSATTTVYLKYEATWSTTAPQAYGNIRALRIR